MNDGTPTSLGFISLSSYCLAIFLNHQGKLLWTILVSVTCHWIKSSPHDSACGQSERTCYLVFPFSCHVSGPQSPLRAERLSEVLTVSCQSATLAHPASAIGKNRKGVHGFKLFSHSYLSYCNKFLKWLSVRVWLF